MRYQFKLEALRRYRRHQEEILQRELGTLQRICDQAVKKLNETVGRHRRTESDLDLKQREPGFASQITMYQRYLKALEKRIEDQQRAVNEAQKACADKRALLLKVVKKRKTLEKLKENGLRVHIANLNQEEQKFIDEMAVNRFTLNQR
jgi:flagellar FliJ protein